MYSTGLRKDMTATKNQGGASAGYIQSSHQTVQSRESAGLLREAEFLPRISVHGRRARRWRSRRDW